MTGATFLRFKTEAAVCRIRQLSGMISGGTGWIPASEKQPLPRFSEEDETRSSRAGDRQSVRNEPTASGLWLFPAVRVISGNRGGFLKNRVVRRTALAVTGVEQFIGVFGLVGILGVFFLQIFLPAFFLV